MRKMQLFLKILDRDAGTGVLASEKLVKSIYRNHGWALSSDAIDTLVKTIKFYASQHIAMVNNGDLKNEKNQ